MRAALALAFTAGCVVGHHPPRDPHVYLERAKQHAREHRPSLALGALFALRAPQLGGARSAEAAALEAEILRDHCPSTVRVQDLIVDDEHYLWPFDGAFWDDELDSYRVPLRSSCPRQR